jgi:hypothetical protein
LLTDLGSKTSTRFSTDFGAAPTWLKNNNSVFQRFRRRADMARKRQLGFPLISAPRRLGSKMTTRFSSHSGAAPT